MKTQLRKLCNEVLGSHLSKFNFERAAAIRSVFRSRYMLVLGLAPILVCFVFALVYRLGSSQLSYTNPNGVQHLNEFLRKFFDDICKPGTQNSVIEKRFDGCTYNFGEQGISTASGFGGPVYVTKSVSFSFISYSDKVLRMKYRTQRVWIKNPEMLPDETGVIEYDLSNHSSKDDRISLRILPYVAFENFLIKKIDEQPEIDFEKPSPFTTWGTVLVGELLQLKSGGGSITAGREFSSFMTNTPSNAYAELKLYFEDGRIFSAGWDVYIYFSASILTSSALGELVPNSSLMKLLVSLESIIGIIWLGLIASVALDVTFGTNSRRED